MYVKIILLPSREEKKLELKERIKVYELVRKLNLNPETVLVLRKNVPIPIDEEIIENETLEIVRVISGG